MNALYVMRWSCWCFLLILTTAHAASELAASDDYWKGTTLYQGRSPTNTGWTETEEITNSDDHVDDVLPSFAKRNPILSRWGGQRLSDLLYYKRRPAFSSWGGKRGPAFSSWGGKRSMAVTGPHLIQPLNSSTGKNEQHLNDYNIYQLIKNDIVQSTTDKTRPVPDSTNTGPSSTLENSTNHKFNFPSHKTAWKENQISNYNNKANYFENGGTEYYSDDYKIAQEDFSLGNHRFPLYDTSNKRAVPSFNSWGGKRAAIVDWRSKWIPEFNHWQGKKATAFNSWGGKRAPPLSSWGGKRTPAFNSWGGKRAPAFNSWGGKRAPAFNSWGGKRAPAFNSWGGKRAPAFNSWGGKRAPAFNSWGGKRAPAFNSWGGKLIPEFNNQNEQEESYREEPEDIVTEAHRQKRSINFPDSKANHLNDQWEEYTNNNKDEKQQVVLNRWDIKRAPAFNSWGGKRAPAFNSWGGKRATAFNSWGGKRAPAFNSWGGKRAPAFNSWGGKRAPAFNSWGGKRIPNDNTADMMTPALDKEDNEEPVLYSRERVYTNEEHSEDKRANSLSRTSGKRLPAFHSWGGKRFKSLTTLSPTENKVNFLGSGTDQNHPLNVFYEDGEHLRNLHELDYGTIRPVDNTNDESQEWVNDDNVDESVNHVVKRSFRLTKDDSEMKRNPAFFSWGGKRNSLQGEEYDKNVEEVTAEESNDYSDNDNEGKLKVFKRNVDGEYLFGLGKSSYTDKRRPIFSSWGGKRSLQVAEGDENVRRKRHAEEEANNEIALVVTSTDSDVYGDSGIRSVTMNDVYSGMPSEMVCCIKRAQYGDRNLFMQMLLRTKSFRDLSWPTIRPIRRGADFYPWGGKRSSL